jgi:hypothetical protein
MKFADATNPNRKSGVAEGRYLQFHSTFNQTPEEAPSERH